MQSNETCTFQLSSGSATTVRQTTRSRTLASLPLRPATVPGDAQLPDPVWAACNSTTSAGQRLRGMETRKGKLRNTTECIAVVRRKRAPVAGSVQHRTRWDLDHVTLSQYVWMCVCVCVYMWMCLFICWQGMQVPLLGSASGQIISFFGYCTLWNLFCVQFLHYNLTMRWTSRRLNCTLCYIGRRLTACLDGYWSSLSLHGKGENTIC